MNTSDILALISLVASTTIGIFQIKLSKEQKKIKATIIQIGNRSGGGIVGNRTGGSISNNIIS